MSVRFAKGDGVPRGPGARAQGPHWTADKSAALTFTGAPRNASAQVVETGPHALNGPRPVGYFFCRRSALFLCARCGGYSGPDVAERRRRARAPAICCSACPSLKFLNPFSGDPQLRHGDMAHAEQPGNGPRTLPLSQAPSCLLALVVVERWRAV